MIRYYKLFDLLNRRGMKKSDLRAILSPKTIAKLSKGENVETNVIDKICLYLHCQPSDIMEVVEVVEEYMENIKEITVSHVFDEDPHAELTIEEHIIETHPKETDIQKSDGNLTTKRQHKQTEIK